MSWEGETEPPHASRRWASLVEPGCPAEESIGAGNPLDGGDGGGGDGDYCFCYCYYYYYYCYYSYYYYYYHYYYTIIILLLLLLLLSAVLLFPHFGRHCLRQNSEIRSEWGRRSLPCSDEFAGTCWRPEKAGFVWTSLGTNMENTHIPMNSNELEAHFPKRFCWASFLDKAFGLRRGLWKIAAWKRVWCVNRVRELAHIDCFNTFLGIQNHTGIPQVTMVVSIIQLFNDLDDLGYPNFRKPPSQRVIMSLECTIPLGMFFHRPPSTTAQVLWNLWNARITCARAKMGDSPNESKWVWLKL